MKMPNKTPKRRWPLIIALLLSGCFVAGCGSSSGSSTSTVASASGAPSASQRAALRTCLRQHGVNLPPRRRGGPPAGGAGGGGGFFGGGAPGARFRANPKLAAAFKACGGRRFRVRRFALSHQAITKFVSCVRQHGYNMPAPNFSGSGSMFPSNIRTNPKFQAASRSCAMLLFPQRPANATSSNPSS